MTSAPTIVSLRTRRLSVPLHTPFVTALRRTTTTDTVVLELTDSDGVTGWGEAPQVWRVTGDSLAGSEACLEGPLRDLLVGARLDLDDLTSRVQRAVVGNRAATMAADIALHDLVARRAGISLHEHLGRVGHLLDPETRDSGRERDLLSPATVLTDVTLAAGEPEALAEAARARVADGFRTLKVKVGTDPDDPSADVARVSAVRAAAPGVDITLDANQGWDAFTAVRIIGALEDAGLDVAHVEQPVPAHDVQGLAYVRAHVDTRIMADESVFDLVDLVEVIRHDGADLVNVKLAKCGGLTPALELLDVCRRHRIVASLGCMMESQIGVGAAAALRVAAGTSPVNDLDAAWWAASPPFVGGITYEEDRVVLPDSPGLGIEGIQGIAHEQGVAP